MAPKRRRIIQPNVEYKRVTRSLARRARDPQPLPINPIIPDPDVVAQPEPQPPGVLDVAAEPEPIDPAIPDVAAQPEPPAIPDVAEPDPAVDVPPQPTTIFIEFCTRDWKFAKLVASLQRGIVAAGLNVNVVTNPAGKSRAGCFEIRTEEKGGHKILSHLNMQRPYKELDEMNVDQLVEVINNFLTSNNANAED